MKRLVLFGLVAYVISAVASTALFSVLAKPAFISVDDGTGSGDDETSLLGQLIQIDPSTPKDAVCPINGKMYTQAEKDAWEKRRPLAVMIENSHDARPQSGVIRADAVYEIVAEGGITRFMGIYYCDAQRDDIVLAPIRSARTYFVDYASGYNLPMYVHVGGSNISGDKHYKTDALGAISAYGWATANDINQFSVGYPTFIRNSARLGRDVATEHTMETTTEKLWAIAEKRKWTNITPAHRSAGKQVAAADWKEGWEIPEVEDGSAKGSVSTISHEFWSGYADFAVKWEYDKASNTYKRTMGGAAHTDLETSAQITVSNVIVIKTVESGPLNEAKHMAYQTTGTGTALIFKNGEVVEGRWTKQDRESQLKFVDSKGDEIPLVRGKQWISVINAKTDVEY